MKNFLAILLLSTGGLSVASAQSVLTEVEPNSTKSEATVFLGFAAGDSITGTARGNTTTAGDATDQSVDTLEIETTAQPTPGWYRYTLMLTGGNSMTLRGLSALGTVGGGSAPVQGSDREIQSSATINGSSLRWYANEAPSRVFVRVQGVSNSPLQYTITMVVDPVTPTVIPSVLNTGSITFDTLNSGHSTNTEIAIADVNRTMVPQYLNSSTQGVSSQASLTRTFAAGTYYLLLTDWDLFTVNGAANDDGALGNLTDFDNTIVNNNVNSVSRLDFEIIDSLSSFSVLANKQGTYTVRIFEFTVGVGALQTFCFGDGGVSPGCTSCPCGNNVASGMPVGCLNSSGRGAQLLRSGVPSLIQDTLRFDVAGANPNTFGLLVSAPNQLPQMGVCPVGSGIAPPNFDGLRCVGGGLFRHGSRSLDVNGDSAVGWGPPDAPLAGLAAQAGFVAGQTRNFQVFYRENPAFVCGSGQNTTNGESVTFIQ